MDSLIKAAEEISYSDSDIKRYLDDDVKILKYPDLANFSSVNELLSGASCACILYMTKQNYGHWTALIKNPGNIEGTYEVFDPYGIIPDDELKFISEEFKEKSNQDRKHLSYLIASDIKKGTIRPDAVFYNKYQLQRQLKDINTCGRWCAVRCAWKFMPINVFCSMFLEQKLPGDAYVTLLTLSNR